MRKQKPTVIMLDKSVHVLGKCGDGTCPCVDDPELPTVHSLLLDGQTARPGEYKRIVNAGGCSESEDLATRPLHHNRPFRIMR